MLQTLVHIPYPDTINTRRTFELYYVNMAFLGDFYRKTLNAEGVKTKQSH